MLKAAKVYLTTQVSTASNGDLLLMLYDTAIKHLRQAMDKMRAGDVAGKGTYISKAIAIVSELQESLNKERGGDISKNLFQLYFFCNTRLLKANLKMDPAMVEEVIGILAGLRQAFAQILPSQEGVASLAQTGPVPGPVAEAEPRLSCPPPAPTQTSAETPEQAAAPETPPQPAAPLNPMRLRAAGAYAGARQL